MTKNWQYFENGCEYRKILKISGIGATLGVLQGIIIGFKLHGENVQN